MNHHAYLYEGSLSLFPQLTDDACTRFEFKKERNPDVHIEQWEKFGIEEARELTRRASLKSTTSVAGESGRALFVLGIASITSEAQQALLKLFEEPQEGTVFIVLIPHGVVLTTLRSRFLPYPITLSGKNKNAEVQEFLASTYSRRSAWATTFLKDEEDVRERARVFINGLEEELYKKLQKEPSSEVAAGLGEIAHMRTYLSDRAPSLKMIFEHVALTLPKI